MSQAHPMIQPTRWGSDDQPEVTVASMPSDRGLMYKLIWETSLACTMRPPLLRHTRAVWTVLDGVYLVSAAMEAVKGAEGYWIERNDVPSPAWPTHKTTRSLESVTINGVQQLERGDPTTGEFVTGLASSGIATPSSLAPLMARLLGRSRDGKNSTTPLVRIEGRYTKLTSDGAERLRLWRGAGLVGHVQRRNELVALVESGQISARDALSQLGGSGHQDLAQTVARQVDLACSRWRGMSREDSLLEQAKLKNKPPRHNALPKWMDPEQLLPQNHPLRVWRERMEAAMAMADPAWHLLEDKQRARARWSWLQENAQQIERNGGGVEFAAAMSEVTGVFSALRYWLTGLQGFDAHEETSQGSEISMT